MQFALFDDSEKGKHMKSDSFKRLIYAIFIMAAANAHAESAQSIIEKVEANQTYQSISYEGTMEIISGSRTMIKTMKAWSVGSDKAFVEFTNPEDRGVRMLKLGKNLWMYFPSEKDTIKITGALLQQGMMGSNISYEDMMEPDILKSRYEASISGEELINDRPCVILTLKALSASVAYSKRVLWVDKEYFFSMKTELYSRGGQLLKTITTLKTDKIGQRYFPTKIEVLDALKKNSKTVFSMRSISIDARIDESIFSLQALSK